MASEIQKIRCNAKEDRGILASILVNNGYTVWQGKEARPPSRKTMEYYVYYQDTASTGAAAKEGE